MKELHFTYRMKLDFDTPVEKHRFTLKCVPCSDTRQEISDLQAEIYPKEFLSEDRDSFGNLCIYGYAEGRHDHFSVRVTGRARTGLSLSEPAGEEYLAGRYRYQTEYTKPGPCICAFAGEMELKAGMSSLQKAEICMEHLWERFSYEQGVTSLSTTAEQALTLGKGVCQDYAHILLSLCRMERIPCRYVTGMLLGEGLSHAWVEIYENGNWYALDPTNHTCVTDQHIKISAGRDYRDCLINQGLFVGQAKQTQTIHVSVTEGEY